MLHHSWLAAALVLLPALAGAQQDKQQPNPLDPGYPGPQVTYKSVFERYQSERDGKETPEKRWIGVNQQLMPKEKPARQPAPAAAVQGGHEQMHGGR
ncbi:MAG: hypothetical protein JWP36_157 [Paucimonas sp.]|nr:hypothetical protein [Paucimonas sp.]